MQRLQPVKEIVQELITATKPVVEKFVQLTKDFKLRGMRVEDIMIKANTIATKLIKEYIEKIVKIIGKLETETIAQINSAKAQSIELWNQYKADSIKTLKEVEAQVMTLQVPYTDKNVKEVVERIRAEIIRLIQWARTVDINKLWTTPRKLSLE